MDIVTPLEIDLLLLFFSFANQYGEVDMKSANEWAKQKFGIVVGTEHFTVEQKHLDILMDANVLADIRPLFKRLK